MKRFIRPLFATTLVAVLVCCLLSSAQIQRSFAQESAPATKEETKKIAKKIIGTWRLEEASNPGSPSGVGTRLKLFTGTHWCVIQPDPDTGVIVFQHGGRYEMQGDKMKTNRDFAGESTKDMIGGTGTFAITIDGDTMKQADSDGVFNETWERVK